MYGEATNEGFNISLVVTIGTYLTLTNKKRKINNAWKLYLTIQIEVSDKLR